MARLNITKSRLSCAEFRLRRIARTSFNVSGNFGPTNRPLFHALRLPLDFSFFVNLISPVACRNSNYHLSLRFVGFAPWQLLDDRFRANSATAVNFRNWADSRRWFAASGLATTAPFECLIPALEPADQAVDVAKHEQVAHFGALEGG